MQIDDRSKNHPGWAAVLCVIVWWGMCWEVWRMVTDWGSFWLGVATTLGVSFLIFVFWCCYEMSEWGQHQ